MTLGRFITFEGVDGAGKSTQLEYAVKYLVGRGVDVIKTREPGGTEIGETIRELILQASSPLDASTELLMIFAARNEHIERVIKPAIARGSTVVCDRFTDATFAYQGGGSQMDSARIETIETWVQGTLQPNLTFFFDCQYATHKDAWEIEVGIGLNRRRSHFMSECAVRTWNVQNNFLIVLKSSTQLDQRDK